MKAHKTPHRGFIYDIANRYDGKFNLWKWSLHWNCARHEINRAYVNWHYVIVGVFKTHKEALQTARDLTLKLSK